MHMSAAVVWLGVQLLSPVSETVPTFNVEPSCKGAAAASAQMVLAQSYSACMDEEKLAREQLVSSWQSFTAANRTRCTEESSGEGLSSYVELLTCLQIAGGVPGNMQPTTPLRGASRKKQ
jgi:hypothetical protein